MATTGRDPAGAVNEALLAGRLTVVDGCLAVDAAAVPVFPNPARWDGTTLAWLGVDYLIGDTIVRTGGYAEISGDLPSECEGRDAFYVSATD